MERYARFVVRHAWLVLLAVALAVTGIGLGMRNLRTEFSFEKNLPAQHPLVQIDNTIRAQFGGRNTIITLIMPRQGDVWRPEVLEVVQEATLAALRLEDVIAQNVVSLAAPSVRYVQDVDGQIDADLLMREVPRTAEEVAALRAKVDGDPQLRGMIVTPDQRAAVLVVDFWDGPTGYELSHRMLDLAASFRDRDVDFYIAGEPVIGLTDVAQSREIGYRMPFVFLTVVLMMLATFRSVQGMLIPMLTAVLSTICGLGLMGHTGLVIDSWNATTPILLIAIAAGHSAQMLKRYMEELERLGNNHAAVIASTVATGPVMIAAGLVAALGFAALALTGVPALAGFGLACAYGIASAVVLEMTFVPALRSLLPAPRGKVRQGKLVGRLLDGLERAILAKRGRAVVVGSVIALLFAVAGAAQIRTYGPSREYLGPGTIPRVHLEVIERHFPGTVTMTILYDGPAESAKSLAVMRHMDGLRAELEKDPLVWRTASIVDLIKTMNRIFNGEAAYRLPDDQPLLSQLVYMGSSPASDRFINRELSKSLLVSYLRDDDSSRVGPLLERARAWVAANPAPEGVSVLIAGGAGPTVLALNEHTTHTKILNIALVLAVIYLMSSLALRSPLGGLYVITPIAASLALLFGFLGWAGIRLDMGSASILAIAAGVGADFAIYFLYRMREEWGRRSDDAAALRAALQTSGRAVIFVAASIGAGFAGMGIFSRYLGLWLFGTLLPLAMVISCLAALSIMPVLVLRTRPAFIFGSAVTPVDGTAPREALT